MGRPSKLTSRAMRLVVSAVARGNTRKVAAEAAGISEPTLYRWLALGAEEGATKAYREFREAIAKAEAGAVMAAVGVVRHAGRTSWQAMAWWLERRYPDEWGRKDRIELIELIRRDAERIAESTGLNAEEIVADAQRFLSNSR